jgi:hypothetical protein
VIEDNSVVGNANGILLLAGVEGDIVRRNFVVGNPPLQVAVDHTSGGGADIVNRATVGANAFHANVCLTAINAPCPAAAPPSLIARPNPIPVTGAELHGMTTISWIAPGEEAVEVRIGSPNGVLFASGGSRGSAPTALWVSDGTIFYLQDVSDGKPLTVENTLATVVVRLERK